MTDLTKLTNEELVEHLQLHNSILEAEPDMLKLLFRHGSDGVKAELLRRLNLVEEDNDGPNEADK